VNLGPYCPRTDAGLPVRREWTIEVPPPADDPAILPVLPEPEPERTPEEIPA
jgi:hypothetical protein